MTSSYLCRCNFCQTLKQKIMYPLNIISETVDTMACDLSGAVQLAPPPHVPLTDYFVNGGPILMSIITILLIAVLFAAWKAPAWVKELGILAFAASLFMTCMSLYQFFETIMLYGEASFRVYCQGLTIALLPFLYGLLVYIVSIIIRIAQKPRI